MQASIKCPTKRAIKEVPVSEDADYTRDSLHRAKVWPEANAIDEITLSHPKGLRCGWIGFAQKQKLKKFEPNEATLLCTLDKVD